MDEYKDKLIEMDEKTKNFRVLAEKIKKKHLGNHGPINTKAPSTRQLLIEFMKEQRKINQMIINRLDKVDNHLDTVIKLNNLRTS